ncbi:hypothetical protein SAMN02745781_02215 [Vibrio gazogenes DSM 21264]|uniref:Uncharacterized protein n=1 Tax=Vibrio gazogenes DSM 21264 = NBRC 103151 TaxID=1123492 RepID=A0A1M5BE73_VIBGA|nr:hypothetical protein SAMN02745781_02215 [Vibrio gazogenes DSM 21264] [Vibrio gazogenes DSM 21264 = NBRC 103151]
MKEFYPSTFILSLTASLLVWQSLYERENTCQHHFLIAQMKTVLCHTPEIRPLRQNGTSIIVVQQIAYYRAGIY